MVESSTLIELYKINSDPPLGDFYQLNHLTYTRNRYDKNNILSFVISSLLACC